MKSYEDAFYKMADVLGVSTARAASPAEVFETIMLPALRRLKEHQITPYTAGVLLPIIEAARVDPEGCGRSLGVSGEAAYGFLKWVAKLPVEKCHKLPPGWTCHHPEGHEGPCAASKINEQ